VVVSVTVEGGAVTVTVSGLSITIYVAVITSVVVSVWTGGTGVARAMGDTEDDASTEDIEDGAVMCGSIEKIMPLVVATIELPAADKLDELTSGGIVEFPPSVDPRTAGAAAAVETASVEAKKSNFESIRVTNEQEPLISKTSDRVFIPMLTSRSVIRIQSGVQCERC
jgi:hypothetical protein